MVRRWGKPVEYETTPIFDTLAAERGVWFKFPSTTAGILDFCRLAEILGEPVRWQLHSAEARR